MAALSVSCLLPLCPARAFLRLSRNSFCRIQTRDSYNQTLWWQKPTGCSTLEKCCHDSRHSPWVTQGNQTGTGGGCSGAHSPLQTPEPQHSSLLQGEAEEITAQRFTSPRRWKSSEITLFGTYHLCELLTLKEHMQGENLKRVHKFTDGIAICPLRRKDKIKHPWNTESAKLSIL